MATIYFDQVSLIEKLKEANLTDAQAQAIVRSISTAQDGLVTKEYMKDYIDHKFDKMESKMNLLQWMLALVIIVNVVPVLTKFFAH